MNTLFPFLLTAALTGGGQPAHFSSLSGTTWTLEQIAPRGQWITLGGGLRPPTLQFGPGQVRGDTGCNSLSGSYKVRGKALSFGPLATTRRGCPDHAMSLESDFLELLARARHFERRGTQLTIFTAGQGQLRFKATSAVTSQTPDQPAVGVEALGGDWQVQELKWQGKAVEVPASAAVTLEVTGSQLRLSGRLDCNQLSATGVVQGQTVHFGPVAATRMACPNMAGERAFGQLLAQPLQWQLGSSEGGGSGGRLHLHGPQGEVMLIRAGGS